MSNEEEFYEILRSKFNESEPPFEEENWNRMREMIDKSRAAKTRTIWLVASLSLLLCTGAAFAIYKWNIQSSKPATVSASYSSANVAAAVSSQALSPVRTSSAVSFPKTSSPPVPELAAGNTAGSASNNTNTTINQALASGNPVTTIVTNQAQGNKTVSEKRYNRLTNQNNEPSSNEIQNTSVNEISSSNPATPASGGISQPPNSAVTKTNVVATVTAKAPDTVSNSATQPERWSDEPFIFRGQKNFFSVEAGASWTGGWQYGTSTQGHGINPLVGIGYMRYITAKVFLKTGLQFSDYGNMGSVLYTTQHQAANIVTDSVITTQFLYYLTVPLQLEYYIHNKNSVGIGGTVSYLLGSSNTGATYQQFDNNPPENIQSLSHIPTLKGYTTWNTSVYLLYRRTFSRKFSMYGIVYYGLTDMKNNSFFAADLFERDKGAKILASYTF